MADDSMYPADDGTSADNGEDNGTENGSDNSNEGQTALLDKSVFPHEPKPGDICNFRIVKVHEDEVEVEYVPEKEEEKEEGSSMKDAMSKMDQMAGGESESE